MRCYRYTLYYPTVHGKPQCYPVAGPSVPQNHEEHCQIPLQSSSEKTTLHVSFFDRIGEDFVRSCTTIQKEDGSCAQGTLLDPTSPAYYNLINGMDYIGEVCLFGKRYFPKYAPIKNKEGRVIGAISVGKCIS